MHQEIVIGPSLIDYLGRNYKLFDFNSEGALLLQRLQDDYVCLDKKRELDDYIEQKIYDYGDDLILTLWTAYASNMLNIKRKQLDHKHSNSRDIQAELASKTKDHLWIKDFVSKEEVDRYKDMDNLCSNNAVATRMDGRTEVFIS